MSADNHKFENLLGLTGLARSGKSEASRLLESEYGYQVIRPSDVVKAALIQRYGDQPFGRVDYRTMAQELRANGGPNWYFDAVDLSSDRVMIDGTRHLERADFIREQGGFLLGFVARTEVRFERAIRAQDAKRKPLSIEEFERDEQPEMNSTDGLGGQILMVLASIEASHILDTSDMNIEEVRAWVVGILASHGIQPDS